MSRHLVKVHVSSGWLTIPRFVCQLSRELCRIIALVTAYQSHGYQNLVRNADVFGNSVHLTNLTQRLLPIALTKHPLQASSHHSLCESLIVTLLRRVRGLRTRIFKSLQRCLFVRHCVAIVATIGINRQKVKIFSFAKPVSTVIHQNNSFAIRRGSCVIA